MGYLVNILGLEKEMKCRSFLSKLHKLVLLSISGPRYYTLAFYSQSAVFYLQIIPYTF